MLGRSNKLSHYVSTLALATAAALPTPAAFGQNQERNPSSEPLTALKTPSRDGTVVPIPDRILAAAKDKDIPLEAIELKGAQWVGCVGDLCVGLGKATKEELEAFRKTKSIEGLKVGQRVYISGYTFPDHVVDPQKALSYELNGVGLFALQSNGSVTFFPDPESKAVVSLTPFSETKPSQEPSAQSRSSVELIEREYSKNFQAEIAAMIEKELDTTFIIDFSVPDQCPPCRELRKILNTLKGQLDPERKLKIIIVNSASFEDAARDTGYRTVPAINIIPALPAATIEQVTLGNESATGDSNRRFVGRSRRTGHVLQGLVSAKRLEAMANRAEARVEQGIDTPWDGLKPAAADVLNAR